MNITIILASPRDERQSHKLADYLFNEIRKKVSATLLDLKEINLHAFGFKTEDNNIERTRNILLNSDGFIFVSPEYHQTYSSVLKNMTEYYWAEFSKKPIGIATVSAGKLGGVQASMHLQSLILALGSYPIPARLLTPEIQNVFDENNQPKNDEFVKKATFFVSEFLDFSTALYQHKKSCTFPGQEKIVVENNLLSELKSENDLGFYSIIEYDIDSSDVQHQFVELFAEIQKNFVASYPGYVSSTFAASIDGERIYNLVHWKSEADFNHFEKISDAKSRMEARKQVVSKLNNKARFREVGSPRYRILKIVSPINKEE